MANKSLSIEQRLESLEVQNLRLKRFVILSCFLLAMGSILALKSSQDPVENFRAERIEIVRDGEVVAVIGSDEEGALFELYDSVGLEYASFLAYEEGGGGLQFSNGSGEPVVWLGSMDDGMGLIQVYDEEGNPSVDVGADSTTGFGFIDVYGYEGERAGWFAATDDGNGAVYIMNKAGNTIGALGSSDDGDGRMRLYSKDGTLAAIAGADSDTGNGYIDVYNSDEQRVAWLAAASDGNGGLHLYNTDDKLVAGMSIDDELEGWFFTRFNSDEYSSNIAAGPNGGYMTLYDHSGNVRFSAPVSERR